MKPAIIFASLLILLPCFYAELVQVIHLGRHGARSPNSFEFVPSQYSEKEGELTVLGLTQQFFLGKEMRKRYVDDLKFLSDSFNSSEVLIRSSYKNRTIRSALAFVNGLYPQESGVEHDNVYADFILPENLLPHKNRKHSFDREHMRKIKIDEEWARSVVDIIAMEGDLHFHATKDDNCPSVDKVLKDLKKSHEMLEMEKYLSLTLYPQVAELFGFPSDSLNIKKAKSILDIVRCNSFHGKDHPQFDELTLKLLKATRAFFAYKITLVDEMVRSVSSSKLLKEFLQHTDSIMKNIESTPKFIFYSGHDTTMELLFSIFLLETKIHNEEQYNIIPFASTVSFEVHRELEHDRELGELVEKHYVQMLYNDEPQFIKWCLGYSCSLEQFHKIIDHHIVHDVETFCSAGKIIKDLIGQPECTNEECTVSA